MLPSLIIEKGILIIPNILPANADVLLSPPVKQYILEYIKGFEIDEKMAVDNAKKKVEIAHELELSH